MKYWHNHNYCRRSKAEAWLKFQILEPQNVSHLDIEFLVNLVLNRETMAIPTKPTKEDLMCLVNSSVAWKSSTFMILSSYRKTLCGSFQQRTSQETSLVIGRSTIWPIRDKKKIGTAQLDSATCAVSLLCTWRFSELESSWIGQKRALVRPTFHPFHGLVLFFDIFFGVGIPCRFEIILKTYLVSKSCCFHLFSKKAICLSEMRYIGSILRHHAFFPGTPKGTATHFDCLGPPSLVARLYSLAQNHNENKNCRHLHLKLFS